MNKILVLGVIIIITLGITVIAMASVLQSLQSAAYVLIDPNPDFKTRAPIAISGDNVYSVWFSDKNMPNNNSEVLFRASTDSGTTFGDKINLSNTTTSDSVEAEIAADGDEVIVTWWERNRTSNEPVFRASVDNGLTFGPLLELATNGTIGESG